MHIRFTLLFIFLLCNQSFGAKIYGRVVDEHGNGLSFTTLHVKGTSIGTTSNADGYYSLEIASGSYDLIFQFVGYSTLVKHVDVGQEDLELNVTLKSEILALNEVVINANNEDPAYEIIRKAIKKRKSYLNEVKGFDCDVYIKGLQRLDERPDKIFGINVTIDTGIVYLSESVSTFSFQHPGKIKEKMISSKVSGRNNAFSFNQASEMMFSFYENIIKVEGLTERGLVSPIANNALLFYRYKLEGTSIEAGRIINKIKVMPIRKTDPVFTGHIYIVEDSWRIHSVDLLLTKDNQIEFVDSLFVNQVYAPVEQNKWMILSQKFTFRFNAFGFKGSGYFISVHSDYQIEPDYEKKYFTNEIMLVEEDANKRDSAYWRKIRPMPLTIKELKDYKIKDSLQVVKESKLYKDSIDRKSNKANFGNVFLTGYTFRKSYKRQYFFVDPLISLFQFNTIEGLATNIKVAYVKAFENRKFYRIEPELRYGFSNNKLNARIRALYYYNPKKFSYGSLSFGTFIHQINQENPINPLTNTITTLTEERNYIKLFQKTFVELKHRTELFNGGLLTSSLEFSEREQLFNSSDFTFNDRENRVYGPNTPVNTILEDTSFPIHQTLLVNFNLRLRIGQKYISMPNRKISLGTKYPTINLQFSKALKNVLGSDTQFDLFQMSIEDDMKFGLLGSANYLIKAGTFLNRDRLTFIDYKHFNGNRTYFGRFELGNFQLLDYYLYSTNGSFLQGHYEQHFNGFIINKLPLIRKTKVQTVVTLNYLRTKRLNNYYEIGFGLEHIFKFLRVDYFTSISNAENARHGVRLGFGF
ncbi:DUF5686 and carboxypeptidase regulatory-like domain-containing protein [Fulvivirgaceae bacterium BMA10]|uniref:DUF5686 and carboxypeptidase regulatory-like domain-containing protein n=2 Tax=Splendidivirga corallicola TaxID=3051826 RepID=A0ABT8KKL2_9BACT|nr:DUF5686 and carboxypeptidase regulatory-like domain-containing protein [Fulvivirgaceae bacterium BMA10]